MATPSLLGLPAELIIKIIDVVQPADHLNFALASPRLSQLSADVLQYHRDCHNAYSLSSDLQTLATPRLLERVFTDPIAAWHIRDLEYWGLRRDWSQWTALVPGSAIVRDIDSEAEEAETQTRLCCDIYRRFGVEQIRASLIANLKFSEDAADEYRDLASKGNEEPLKLLVMALSPRLRSLKIPNVSPRSSQVRLTSQWRHPLIFLSRVLQDIHLQAEARGLRKVIWPPGFASLRSISIGVRASSGHGYILPFLLFMPLFALPNLEYFYLDHPYTGFERRGLEQRLPRRASTVKHVHITSGDLELNEVSEMLAGIAKLNSFSLQSLQRNGCDVLRFLGIHHGDNLEYLDVCDTDILSRLYERYFSRLSMNGLKMFPNLKYIAIDLLVLLHQHIETRYGHPGQLVILKPHTKVDTINLTTILPASIEYVAFKVSSSNYHLTEAVTAAVSGLVARTIKSGAFPNLKAIFFEDIAPQKPPNSASPASTQAPEAKWLEEAVTAGIENSVDVYTHWTHPGRELRRRKDELGIPRAMTARDMRTDPRNR